MSALSVRLSLFAVVALLATGLASSSARAQTPPATPGPAQCPNVLTVPGHPVDAALHPSLTASWDVNQRGILVQWDSGAGASCAWFQVKRGSAGYSGASLAPNFRLG